MNKTTVKIISCLFTVISGILVAQSCTDEIPRVFENTVMSLERMSLNLSAGSAQFDTYQQSGQTVTVRAENIDWEFTDIPEWISVTPVSGSGDTEVRIEISENPVAVNRVGVLTFRSVGSAWNYSTPYTVSQYRAPYSISLPVDTVQVLSESTTRTVQVDVNTDTWKIIIPESMDWCTARKAEGGLVITVDENSAAYARKGVIELHTDDVSAYLTVTQHPAGVKTVTSSVDFNVEGGTKSMGVDISASWSIDNIYSWIDVGTMSGDAGFVTLPIQVTPNYDIRSRDGYIYIVISSDNKIAIPVHQQGIDFRVDESVNVPSTGSTSRLDIHTNMPWKFCIDSIPGWISVDPQSGTGSTQVLLTVKPNMITNLRSASLPIDIMSHDGSSILSHTAVDVIQDGFSFGADSTAINFSDIAGTISFNIKSDGYWSAYAKENWITISPDDGRGNAQIQVSVTANMDSTARMGSVILMTEGSRDTISVYQAGKVINVSSKVLAFHSQRDSAKVSLRANGPWTASASAGWIELSESEGDGNCDITIIVQDNPFASSRLGEVIVTRGGYNPVKISVTQAGRYLNISTNYIVFFDKGGTSEPITVQTDGTWTIATPDWIIVNKETESQFTITVPENTGTNTRTATLSVYLTDLTNGSLQRTITVLQGAHFEAEYVDLGLSVYWATCNVGATTPEGYGNVYSWGEITTNYHSWYYYTWCNGTQSTLKKYNSYSDYGYDGFVDYKTVLDPADDVAGIMWGGDWRMPTKYEFDELVNNCVWVWTTQGGVNGYRITSLVPGYTDRSIFLPAAGSSWGSSVGDRGKVGDYWQSNVSFNPGFSWNMHFYSGYYSVGDNFRCAGYPIRPVRNSPSSDNVSVILSRTAMSIAEGKTDTILATVRQKYEITGHDVQWSSSNNSIATVTPSGVVTGVAPGICTITASTGSAQAECLVNVTSISVTPEYVDLGLSVNWATFNVGADRPEGFGDYFAWGETESKSSYYWSSYKYCNGSDYHNITKYCNSSDWGTVDNKFYLEPVDDAATILWGDDWRMPRPEEMEELIQNCTWVWTSLNEVDGYMITSNVAGYTDRSIFLPATGVCGVDNQMGVGFNGQYWTSSSADAGWVAAWKLIFNQGFFSVNSDNRFYGYPIRPVTKKTSQTSAMSIPEPVDLGLSVMWAPYNVGASSPEKYGYYYAWAETSPKMSYTSSTYKWLNNNKYNTNINSPDVSSLEYIELADDPANVNWGDNWRMPTADELSELWDNCDVIGEEYNGVFGWTMTSRINGNSIFIPASGVKQETAVVGAGQYCYMFASDMYYTTGNGGFYYYWLVRGDAKNNSISRYTGVIVRPVWASSIDITPVDSVIPQIDHEYVDLGLSVKWATTNVGAVNPEEYGDYYAWGETETKDYYEWSTYKWSIGEDNSTANLVLTKYNTSNVYGSVDNKTILEKEDDVASVKWGGSWHIPTMVEFNELRANCNWVWTTLNGVYGYRVTSKIDGYTDRSIFLPAGGYRAQSELFRAGDAGCYWSSTLRTDNNPPYYAYSIFTNAWDGSGYRNCGRSVRPVCP